MTLFLFLATFLYALLGASGTVPAYRDSGDLVASIHTLGIAHPPGYALYVLIGKLFVTLIPFGNVAYRVNAMSALFAAATVVVVYRYLMSFPRKRESMQSVDPRFRGDDKRIPALAAAVVLASAPAFLSLSRVPEMYTLSACLAASILALLRSDHPKSAAWAALLLGLGLSVHPTLLFLVPLFAARKQSVLEKNTWLYLALGVSVFLYLPLRAMQDPALNWGDPSHWRNFWRVVTRADYGGLKLHPMQSVFAWTPQSLWAQIRFFVQTFHAQIGTIAFLLGGAGILERFRRSGSKAGTWGHLAAWVLSGPAFVILSNLPLQEASTPAILEPYLLIPLVLWMPWVVDGGRLLLEIAKGKSVLVFATLAVMLLWKPWGWVSQRQDYYAYDYARNLLRALPEGAVLYDPDDPTHFTLQALKYIEGRRPDVTLLSFFRTRWGYEQIRKRSPDLLPAIPISNAQELERVFWTYSATKRPFYAELPVKFGSIPYRVDGLVYAAALAPDQRSTIQSRQRAKDQLASTVQRGDFVTTHHQDFFIRHLLDYYASAHCNLGLEFAAVKDWPSAVREYEAALAINPEQSAALNNLGIVAFERADYPAALRFFERGLQLEPNNEMLRKNALVTGQKMAKNL